MKDLSNRNVQLIQTDNVDYLRFPIFDQYGVVAVDAIKGRQGKTYVGDEADANFQILCRELNIGSDKLVAIQEQIHSDICVRIDNAETIPTHCDCIMTNVPGIALVTREADCVPILIYDPVNKAIANVHSGWRGTVKHIVVRAIEAMANEYGSRAEDLIVGLLPSIGFDHFKVRDDVREPFLAEFDHVNLRELGDGKYLLDVAGCVKEDLLKAGVKNENIYDSDICAACEADQINSCRGGAGSMRNAALICIKD